MTEVYRQYGPKKILVISLLGHKKYIYATNLSTMTEWNGKVN